MSEGIRMNRLYYEMCIPYMCAVLHTVHIQYGKYIVYYSSTIVCMLMYDVTSVVAPEGTLHTY